MMQMPQNYRKYGVRRMLQNSQKSFGERRPLHDPAPYPNKHRKMNFPGRSPRDQNANFGARSGRYFNDSLRAGEKGGSSFKLPNGCSSSSASSVGRERQVVKRKVFSDEAPDFISLDTSEPMSKRRKAGDDQEDEFGSVPYSPREARRLFESDRFSEQIMRFFKENQQRQDFVNKKFQLKAALQKAISYAAIQNSNLYMVGSTVNGFGRITSDADFCLVVNCRNERVKERKRAFAALNQVKNLLERAPFVSDLQLIPAKVPIIKFKDIYSGMDCDINVNNLTGIRNTELMRQYSKLDPRVRPLALIVKEWAHQQCINDASKGTLNSYSIVLMVIHFLQRGAQPAVLPSLQEKHPELFATDIPVDKISIEGDKIQSFQSRNKSSLSQLLRQFFEYFAEFNFRNDIMSVRLGKIIKVYNVKDIKPWQRKDIKIEEPFDLTNTARAVHNGVVAHRIFFKIKDANIRLQRGNSLSSILRNAPQMRATGSVIVLDDEDDVIVLDD